ncbi:sulfite exporter TauE/SafE family protein [Methylomicrobium album]|nr:sulfite exporter TauE/SafE family protein [Methylomicrobium album]
MMDHAAMQGMAEAAAAAGGFDYTLAFVAGFLGSGHCLGMCGALVSGYFMNAGKQRSYWPYLLYQAARISVYGLIGIAAALLGVVLVSGGVFGKIQSILQMLIGLVVIGLALGILGWLPRQGALRLLPVQWLRKGYAASRRQGPLGGALLAGLLNGMMPCPLTFAMAVKAVTAPNVLGGGTLMLAFGAGTLPMMLFISLAFGRIQADLRGRMYRAAAMVMVVMGINTFYRGLSFYLDQNFKHHNHYVMLQAWVNELMAYLYQLVAYFGDLVGNIQNM